MTSELMKRIGKGKEKNKRSGKLMKKRRKGRERRSKGVAN